MRVSHFTAIIYPHVSVRNLGQNVALEHVLVNAVYERSHGYDLGYKPDVIGAIRTLNSQESDYDGSRATLTSETAAKIPETCHLEKNIEYNGQVVVWGGHHAMVSRHGCVDICYHCATRNPDTNNMMMIFFLISVDLILNGWTYPSNWLLSGF